MLQFHHFYAECIIFILNFVIFMQSSINFMLKYYILCVVTTYKGTLFMHTYIRYLYIECAFNMSSNKSNTAGFVNVHDNYIHMSISQCRSYFMFHGMDVKSPESIFKYLPMLSFTESFIYQVLRYKSLLVAL